jgi:hypothetical protein
MQILHFPNLLLIRSIAPIFGAAKDSGPQSSKYDTLITLHHEYKIVSIHSFLYLFNKLAIYIMYSFTNLQHVTVVNKWAHIHGSVLDW